MLFYYKKYCYIEIRPVTLKEGLRLKVGMFGIVRKTSGAKKEELIESLIKLHNKKVMNVFY
jgi:hypothetical protein